MFTGFLQYHDLHVPQAHDVQTDEHFGTTAELTHSLSEPH